MRTLRIVPHLRSSVVEEMPADQALLFTSERRDADVSLYAGRDVRPFSWRALLRALRDPDLELLEVAEPLWTAEWVRALRYVVLARVVPRRRAGRVAVATYAIENLDARERLRRLPHRPVLGALASRLLLLATGASMLLLDTVVFGTTGAADNHRRAFGWAVRRTRHAVLPPRLGPCSVCGTVDTTGPREPTVLFLGAPGERKGFSVLVAAWERSGAAARGWRLLVADPEGDRELGDLPDGVSVRVALPRAEIHRLLRTAAVVAMPSVRRPGWREQIGLPLVEGLAHGCRVVTTTETGLAPDLGDHPHVVLTAPGDVDDLAAGLHRAMAPSGRSGTSGYVGHTKRDVVAWWLAQVGGSSGRSPS
ncbi:glycosyltransferase family 4 protein [Actinomycetospora chiangmaiensis]|uniref:glycosyltransferase family 4 protein n=1 Tax=Actinomycetospora chiangmaiensis TaxID=402650 RepID=UPI0003A9E41B|nr:glycosyltransferase family 4 protein [Actinomycetospora chiangmaiensis]